MSVNEQTKPRNEYNPAKDKAPLDYPLWSSVTRLLSRASRFLIVQNPEQQKNYHREQNVRHF